MSSSMADMRPLFGAAASTFLQLFSLETRDMDTEQRLIEMETKIAFLDNTIEELNEVITDQQRQIDLLGNKMKSVLAKLQAVLPAING